MSSLLVALEAVRAGCLAAEHEFADALAEVRPLHRTSARNLVHYVALRRLDLRTIQEDLARLGLSSLGRSEAHVMGSLETVIGVLECLEGDARSTPSAAVVEEHSQCLEHNADRLLGALVGDRATRIMVTLPSGAANHPEIAASLVHAGMDVARINCAHDTPAAWRSMARHVRAAARAQSRWIWPVRSSVPGRSPRVRLSSGSPRSVTAAGSCVLPDRCGCTKAWRPMRPVRE